MKYIIALDQSTTATKAILFDENACLVGRYNCEHQQIYPQPGWVEHDPNEIYQNTLIAIRNVIDEAGISKRDVKAIAISNQRETTILWDDSGKPVYNAIVWQCNRAKDIIKQKKIADSSDYIQEATGIPVSPYFPSAKAKWICSNIQNKKGTLFGTVDSWLVWNLTGNHYTDYSNASRTQLFNINTCEWDKTIIDCFDLNNLVFPIVKYSDDIFGMTTLEGYFEQEIPVTGVMGDSHAALFGQKCFTAGSGKATFGTGTSVMINIGNQPKGSEYGLVTSIAWGIGNKVEYVFEGNINSSGDTIKWLAEGINLLTDSKESEAISKSVDNTNGVYFVPAFHGLGAPHWDYDCQGIICGIRRDTNKSHIVRAGLESIAYQICDIVRAAAKDMGKDVETLYVDGGATNNELLMQFVSDILRIKLVKAEIEELSARGSAFAAGMAIGFWDSKEDISNLIKTGDVFTPKMPIQESEMLYDGWQKALKRTMYKA